MFDLKITDISGLERSLHWWERADYVATGVVFIGVLGELLAEFTNLFKTQANEARKKRFTVVFTLVLLLGLGWELTALIRTSILTGEITEALRNDITTTYVEATKASEQASEAAKRAERIVTIGQIFENEARMRGGLRSGFDDLTRLIKSTADPEIAQIAKRSLQRATEDFEDRMKRDRRNFADSPLTLLRTCRVGPLARAYEDLKTLDMVVGVINGDSDLYCVAAAFETFNWMPAVNETGTKIKMFDVNAVAAWCSRYKTKCKAK